MAGYQADVVCGRAADFIGAATSSIGTDKPWFCVASLESPHPPYDAPAGGETPVAPASIVLRGNVPLGGEVEEKARRELAGYYAHIGATDRAIGRLIEAAREATARRSSRLIVVFTSVHGDMHGAHGLFRKGWPYEESIRIPLLVSLPDGVGETRDDLVTLADLPWLIETWIDRGTMPRIEREYAAISMPSVVRLPEQCDRVWRGYRSNTQKRIFNADGSLWLHFDLASDPGENANLASNLHRLE
jgi:hypothetical protein